MNKKILTKNFKPFATKGQTVFVDGNAIYRPFCSGLLLVAVTDDIDKAVKDEPQPVQEQVDTDTRSFAEKMRWQSAPNQSLSLNNL